MSDISSIGHGPENTPVGPLNRIGSSTWSSPKTRQGTEHEQRATDRVELSEHARLLDRLRQLPDVRAERVEAIREAIARGEYETPERLEAAIDNLLEELAH